jgi:hypothetical protein
VSGALCATLNAASFLRSYLLDETCFNLLRMTLCHDVLLWFDFVWSKRKMAARPYSPSRHFSFTPNEVKPKENIMAKRHSKKVEAGLVKKVAAKKARGVKGRAKRTAHKLAIKG